MNNQKVSRNVIKIAQALGFLLDLDENHKIERVKLMKLLWAADRLHLRKYGRTISESDYFAMVHGPVCSLALDIARLDPDGIALSDVDKQYLGEFFTSDSTSTSMQKKIDDGSLSDTDKEMLKRAWELFGDEDTFHLSDDISHRYPEWEKFSSYFSSNSGSKKIDIEDFFKNPENDSYFNEESSTLSAAKHLYEENKKAEDELTKLFNAKD